MKLGTPLSAYLGSNLCEEKHQNLLFQALDIMLPSSLSINDIRLFKVGSVPAVRGLRSRPSVLSNRSHPARAPRSKGSPVCDSGSSEVKEVDVVVIGAGICGATFARQLVPQGYNVVLVDAGAQQGKRPGW